MALFDSQITAQVTNLPAIWSLNKTSSLGSVEMFLKRLLNGEIGA